MFSKCPIFSPSVFQVFPCPAPCPPTWQVSRVIRVVIFGMALPCYAVVGAGGLWLFDGRVSANVLQEREAKVFFLARLWGQMYWIWRESTDLVMVISYK